MKIKKRFWFLSDSVVGEMWQKIWEEEETIEKNSKNLIWKNKQRDVMIYGRKNESSTWRLQTLRDKTKW